MEQAKITFIGGGNMARALIAGLINTGYEPSKITVSNPSLEKLELLHARFGVHITQDNQAAAANADVIVFAVKPWHMQVVCEELRDVVTANSPLLISIATGITTASMQNLLGAQAAVVRAMPNTPVAVGAGATGLFANTSVSEQQHNFAESLFQAVGVALWLEQESQLEAVTAVSGSGPAYIFLVIESIQQAGIDLGLPAETAKVLTAQMAIGAAKMALELDEEVSELREAVTSPQGTTAAALDVLEQGKLRELMAQATRAACQRGQELSDLNSNS